MAEMQTNDSIKLRLISERSHAILTLWVRKITSGLNLIFCPPLEPS